LIVRGVTANDGSSSRAEGALAGRGTIRGPINAESPVIGCSRKPL
jgi:hypothetical protein